MDKLTETEAETLRSRLREHDLPVNAMAKVLGVRDTSMQRFLSGRYDIPAPLGRVLAAVCDFRDAARVRLEDKEGTQ